MRLSREYDWWKISPLSLTLFFEHSFCGYQYIDAFSCWFFFFCGWLLCGFDNYWLRVDFLRWCPLRVKIESEEIFRKTFYDFPFSFKQLTTSFRVRLQWEFFISQTLLFPWKPFSFLSKTLRFSSIFFATEKLFSKKKLKGKNFPPPRAPTPMRKENFLRRKVYFHPFLFNPLHSSAYREDEKIYDDNIFSPCLGVSMQRSIICSRENEEKRKKSREFFFRKWLGVKKGEKIHDEILLRKLPSNTKRCQHKSANMLQNAQRN